MIVIPASREMQALALEHMRSGRRIGLVPTMGFLHEGHISLVRIAKEHSDLVVLTSFVNPTQFGPQEDFSRYPRDNERDDALCRQAGVDIVFRPSPHDIYGRDHSVYVDETSLSSGLCGRFRPGHFRGVVTIVAKLFNITMPHAAVFGRKDAQQARVIEQMARDLNFPVKIVVAPIVRESDGLAMSSRNAYLSPSERIRAAGIYASLLLVERLYADGVTETAVLVERLRSEIVSRAQPDEIQYVEAVDYGTLKPVDTVKDATLIAVAVKIGQTRLIDNILLLAGT